MIFSNNRQHTTLITCRCNPNVFIFEYCLFLLPIFEKIKYKYKKPRADIVILIQNDDKKFQNSKIVLLNAITFPFSHTKKKRPNV